MDSHLKHIGSLEPLDQRHREYGLMAAGTPLADLRLGNPQASWATAEIGGALLVFRRDTVLKKQVSLHHHGHDIPLATFHADMLCRGELQLGTALYYWRPVNKRWTQWSWQTAEGHDVVSIKLRHGPIIMSGEVYASHSQPSPEQLQLILLGWYLLILNHQPLGNHLAAGFDIYLGKLAGLRK